MTGGEGSQARRVKPEHPGFAWRACAVAQSPRTCPTFCVVLAGTCAFDAGDFSLAPTPAALVEQKEKSRGCSANNSEVPDGRDALRAC